ncbi:MAG TPA: hypothetical protein VGG04_09525 [Candidatus Sulfotelmatobacter sp.]
MRITRFLNIAVLSTLVGMSGALYAQDEKPQEAKPKQEEVRPEAKQDEMKAPKQEKQDQMKPEQQEKQDQMKPAQQGDMKPEKPEKQEEAKPSKEEQKAQKEQQKQQEKTQKDEMKHDQKEPAEHNGNNAHPVAQSNAGAVGHPKGKSARIPEDRFKSNFGRSHTFVVQRTTVVQGQPGFVSGGVNFIFLDPWPSDWAYSDDCYVDYIDGEYFLFDMLHPGIRIALFVVL